MSLSVYLGDEGDLKCGHCRKDIMAVALVPYEIKGRRALEGIAYIPSCNDCISKIRKSNGEGSWVNHYPDILLETW